MIKIKLSSILLCNAVLAFTLLAEIKTPAVIGNNMVLQQNHKNPIWGWDNPGESIKLTIANQSHETKVDQKGYWKMTLNPMKASTSPKTMTIRGSSTLKYENILIGEVWLCSCLLYTSDACRRLLTCRSRWSPYH